MREGQHKTSQLRATVHLNFTMDPNAKVVPATIRQQSASTVPSKSDDEGDPTTRSLNMEEIQRPKVRFDSPSVFLETLWARFASIWTKRFILSLLAGQLVSLCMTCTSVTTTELVKRGWALHTDYPDILHVSATPYPPALPDRPFSAPGTSLCS